MQHLIKSHPSLAQQIYKKLGINIFKSRNEQDSEKIKTSSQQKDDGKILNKIIHDKVSTVSNIFIDIPNVKWKEISIIKVEENKFKFTCKKKSYTYTLIELGFMDHRTKEPSEAWQLLKLLAKAGGHLPSDFLYGKNRGTIVKRLSRLRKQIRDICGIPQTKKHGKPKRGSPIIYNKISRTYDTEFLTRDDFTSWRNTPEYLTVTSKMEIHK